MKNMPTQAYSLYEGTFLSPAPVQDRSVNILMFRDPDNNEYNIIINRARLEEKQSVKNYCESQMEVLRFKQPGFQIEGKLLTRKIGPAKISVTQVANRFLHEGKTVRQVQSIIQLPADVKNNPTGLEILIFTLNARNEFTEYQRKHYVQVLNTFNPGDSK